MPVAVVRSPLPQLLQVDETPMECETITRGVMKKASAPRKPQRNVRFNGTVNVRAIVHIDDMPEGEIDAIWFQKQDFQNMKNDFVPTVRMIIRGVYAGDDEHNCARGLEYRHKAGAQKRKLNKLNALCAVLDEQERQQEMGIYDDEILAAAYIRRNSHCRKEAVGLAMRDAEEARALIKEDGMDCNEEETRNLTGGIAALGSVKKDKRGDKRTRGLFSRAGGQRRKTDGTFKP